MSLSCALAACGGDDDGAANDDGGDPGSGSSSSGSQQTSSGAPPVDGMQLLGGTAAIGMPLAGASVTARCADGSGFTASVGTGAQGAWTGSVGPNALPCALEITSSTPAVTLHGLATAAGVANLTPLTDLILALAARQLPATWYATPTFTEIAARLADATETLRSALAAAGFTMPPGAFAPFTSAFVAGAGDPWDKLLEELAAALAAHPESGGYAGLLAQFAAGNTGALPAAVSASIELAGRNGITGVVGTTPHTFVDNVTFSSMVGMIGAYGSNGTGGFDPLTRWVISGVPKQVGTYACKSDAQGILPKIELQLAGAYSGTPPAGGACSLTVTRLGIDEVEGTFTATMVAEDGTTTTQVTDGHFRKINDDDGGGQPLGAAETGGSFVVDGRTYHYEGAVSLAYEEFAGVKLQPSSAQSPGYPLGIQIHTIPNQTGTYACDSGSNPYRKVNVWFAWHGEVYTAGNRNSPAEGPAGSSCSITVATTGTVQGNGYLGTFDGSFSGTFVSSDGARSVVVTDGKFRL